MKVRYYGPELQNKGTFTGIDQLKSEGSTVILLGVDPKFPRSSVQAVGVINLAPGECISICDKNVSNPTPELQNSKCVEENANGSNAIP